jgi:hypothetical protein
LPAIFENSRRVINGIGRKGKGSRCHCKAKHNEQGAQEEKPEKPAIPSGSFQRFASIMFDVEYHGCLSSQ